MTKVRYKLFVNGSSVYVSHIWCLIYWPELVDNLPILEVISADTTAYCCSWFSSRDLLEVGSIFNKILYWTVQNIEKTTYRRSTPAHKGGSIFTANFKNLDVNINANTEHINTLVLFDVENNILFDNNNIVITNYKYRSHEVETGELGKNFQLRFYQVNVTVQERIIDKKKKKNWKGKEQKLLTKYPNSKTLNTIWKKRK